MPCTIPGSAAVTAEMMACIFCVIPLRSVTPASAICGTAAVMNSTSPVMIPGRASTRPGTASRIPFTSASMIAIPAFSSASRFPGSASTAATPAIASAAAEIRSGSASASPFARFTTISTPACAMDGAAAANDCTSAITSCPPAVTSCGTTEVIMDGSASAITGAICPTKSVIPDKACSTTGIRFPNAVDAESTRFPISPLRSAFPSAKPTSRFCQAAEVMPRLPEIVELASFAVVPSCSKTSSSLLPVLAMISAASSAVRPEMPSSP